MLHIEKKIFKQQKRPGKKKTANVPIHLNLIPKMGKWALAQKAMKRKDRWRSGIMFINGFTSPSFPTALDLKAATEMERLT